MSSLSEFYFKGSRDSRRPSVVSVLEGCLIVTLFFVFAGGEPPGINESHYLTRAKYFWNPEWCAGDSFLSSTESQPLFHLIFGWPSKRLELPAMAWLGRLVGWTMLAAGWIRINRVLGVKWGWSLLSASVAIMGWDRFHMAGEWVVGGWEAKVPAYACVFMGLAALMQDRRSRAMLWLSCATSFHPLVGGWSLLAALFSFVARSWTAGNPNAGEQSFFRREPMIPQVASLVFAVLLVALGVIPALLLDWGADTDTVQLARVVYVMRRLNHHLLVTHFPWSHVVRHVLMIGLWLWAWRLVRGDARQSRLHFFVLGCVAIAAAGLVIECITIRSRIDTSIWMRYYWYRMSDSMVPVGAALAWCGWVRDSWHKPSAQKVMVGMLTLSMASISFTYVGRQYDPRPAGDRQGSRRSGMGASEYSDWVEACTFCRSATEPDSMFLVPTYIQTFKWYAHRPDYVTWKDIPQGSRAIADWWQRRAAVRRLGIYASDSAVLVSHERMQRWMVDKEIDYVIVPRASGQAPWRFRVLFENRSYRIYCRSPIPEDESLDR